MLAAIISVGTELTSGQILNKNAQWIAKALKDFGVPTSSHLAVPDDRRLILEALDFCAEHCDTLFVTGGLGPTTDDFTRELISEWSGCPLEFHKGSWESIQDRFRARGLTIRESQRQQCFYPKGSRVIPNPEGTANAFYLRAHEKDLFVLPGPPKEVSAVWHPEIETFLRDKTKSLDKHVTYSWDTIGLGESDVAELTENCLIGVDIEKGYRVHAPYVEVKLSFFESQKHSHLAYVEKVESALQAITVTRNGEDLPTLLATQLARFEKFHIVDSYSGSALLERLAPSLRATLKQSVIWSFSSAEQTTGPSQDLKLLLKSGSNGFAHGELHYQGQLQQELFEAPFSIANNPARQVLYFTERAMVFWLQEIKKLHK